MSEEIHWLTRGATSLTLMLKGYDNELDRQLDTLKASLKEKTFNLNAFKNALQDVEHIYDGLENVRNLGLSTYKQTFEYLLNKEQSEELLTPLQVEHPLIIDFLRLAEPIAKQINLSVEKTHGTSDTDQLKDLRDRLVNRFKALLNTLSLLGDNTGELNRIEEELSASTDWKTLDNLAKKTIKLLKERLAEEQKQFEGYLSELNKKLTRITQIVESDSKTLSELKKINEDFNESISFQMSEARARIDAENKVDSLKGELLESLDNIAQRLESYQINYGSKLQSLQTSKEEMTHHIHELEQENLMLMTELQKERKLSMQDTLTQLPNRQGFNQRLDEELSRVQRYNQSLSIAMLDIDFFKKINDKFGHLVGDKVLRMIAKEMKSNSRESDYLARFGGEEFILLLPQTPLKEAIVAVEKIRQHIETRPFHFQNKPVPLTVSGGVAQFIPGEEVETWLDRADSALYMSKRNGRNKVTGYTQEQYII